MKMSKVMTAHAHGCYEQRMLLARHESGDPQYQGYAARPSCPRCHGTGIMGYHGRDRQIRCVCLCFRDRTDQSRDQYPPVTLADVDRALGADQQPSSSAPAFAGHRGDPGRPCTTEPGGSDR